MLFVSAHYNCTSVCLLCFCCILLLLLFIIKNVNGDTFQNTPPPTTTISDGDNSNVDNNNNENYDEHYDDFVIAGYLPEYRSYVNVNNTTPYLTDLIIFSVSPSSMGFVGGCCLDVSHYDLIQKAKAYKKQQYNNNEKAAAERHEFRHDVGSHTNNNELRLWVTVGGAGRSENFVAVASDPKKKERFIKSLINLCTKNHLVGFDFNWEIRNQNEYQLLSSLIIESSMRLKKHNANILISVATRTVFPKEVIDVVDRFNIMTYDLMNPNQGIKHHAQYDVVITFVEEWLNKVKCPPHKIILGLPMYARHADRIQDVLTFSEIIDKQYNNDNDQQTLYDKDMIEKQYNWNGYLFDSPELIRKKVNYAIENNLGGVFFWELGQDKQITAAATTTTTPSTSSSSSSGFDNIDAPGGILLQAVFEEASSALLFNNMMISTKKKRRTTSSTM